MKKITIPINKNTIENLTSGDAVLLSGTIYTARDAAHKRLVTAVKNKEKLPFTLNNAVIYYVGPTPAKPNMIIGAAGPTTASRMDTYAKILIPLGLKIMIGKGQRNDSVKNLIVRHKGLYLVATGGIAAVLTKTVKKCKLIAYPDLGPEAIYRLEVEDFPAIVAYDSHGGDLFKTGINKYQKNIPSD